MNPTLLKIITQKPTIVQPGLVAEYRFEEGTSQVLYDYRGKNNGQLGSTTGGDTNDPTRIANGLTFATDDYVKLPYVINVEQNFTIFIVASVGALAPAAIETYFSAGNSSMGTQYMWLRRWTDGILGLGWVNDAGVADTATISAANVIPGIRLIVVKRSAESMFFKDVAGGLLSSVRNAPANPTTFNQITLGSLGRTIFNNFLNQSIYAFLAYNRATTTAEDAKIYKALKRKLVQVGVVI